MSRKNYITCEKSPPKINLESFHSFGELSDFPDIFPGLTPYLSWYMYFAYMAAFRFHNNKFPTHLFPARMHSEPHCVRPSESGDDGKSRLTETLIPWRKI
jgi:hypothetical protein